MAVAQYPFAKAPFGASLLESPNALVDATGVEATATLGNESLVTNNILSLTGVSATGATGSVTVSGKSNLTLTGVSATGEIGIVITNAFPTGVEATGGVGTVTVTANAEHSLTGVQGTTFLGQESQIGAAMVYPVGVEAEALLNTINVWGLVDTQQTPNWRVITT